MRHLFSVHRHIFHKSPTNHFALTVLNEPQTPSTLCRAPKYCTNKEFQVQNIDWVLFGLALIKKGPEDKMNITECAVFILQSGPWGVMTGASQRLILLFWQLQKLLSDTLTNQSHLQDDSVKIQQRRYLSPSLSHTHTWRHDTCQTKKRHTKEMWRLCSLSVC